MTILLKKYRKAVVPCLASAFLVVLNFHDNSWAGPYTDSAHGNSSTGIERSTLGVSAGGAAGFAIGNCIHCHEQHASVEGDEPTPDNTGPDIYLGFDVEEALCYGCHGTGDYEPATRQVRDLIETDTTKTYGHDPSIAQYYHRANETTVDGINTAAHIECTDCHNPHQAKTENNATIGPRAKGTNVIGPNSPLLGVSGVEFDSFVTPATWTNAMVEAWSTPVSTFTYLNDDPSGEGYSTKEYQVCFKCHSSFSSNTDDWDGNPPGVAGEWTDVALEFNPANASYHPVVAAISGDNLNSEQLKGVDRTWTAGDTMYCSDCHGSDDVITATTDRYGPHGSATKWLLTGTHQNWPFQSVANNGSSAATNWADITSAAAATTFCHNCHPDPTDATAGADGQSNNVHTVANHTAMGRTLECVFCHIRVPHGGKVSRLISTNTPNLPNRYTPDGNGGINPYIDSFLQQTTHTAYGSGNCQVGGAPGMQHNTAPVGGESW